MAGGSTLRRLYAFLVSLSLLSALCAADAVSDLQKKGRAAVDAEIAKSTTCTKDKVKVRKEWYVYHHCTISLKGTSLTDLFRGDITAAEKKAYIAAVLCEHQTRH